MAAPRWAHARLQQRQEVMDFALIARPPPSAPGGVLHFFDGSAPPEGKVES
jgi:hypothetical protein